MDELRLAEIEQYLSGDNTGIDFSLWTNADWEHFAYYDNLRGTQSAYDFGTGFDIHGPGVDQWAQGLAAQQSAFLAAVVADGVPQGRVIIGDSVVVAPNSGATLSLGDETRIILGVANAISPNPVASAIDTGIATAQLTGSVYTGINAAVNPAYGLIAGSYEAGTGMSLNPDTVGQTLTTGGRVLSGVSAGLNGASLVGIGVGGAKLLSPMLPNLVLQGPTSGLQYGNGRVFQIRVDGQPPLFRVDYQPIPGSGTQPVLHIDSPPLNLSHLPITTPPPRPSGPVPPIH